MGKYDRIMESLARIVPSELLDESSQDYLVPNANKISLPLYTFLKTTASDCIAVQTAYEVLSERVRVESSPGLNVKSIVSELRSSLPEEDHRLLDSVAVAIRDARRNGQYAICEMFVVSQVSCFEAFVQDLTYNIFMSNPNTLKSDKTLTYKEIIDRGNTDDLVEFIARKEASRITDGPVLEYLARLERRFNAKLVPEILSELLELVFAVRHAIVHNKGIAEGTPENLPLPGIKVGERVSIGIEVASLFSQILVLMVALIDEHLVNNKFQDLASVTWSEECDAFDLIIRQFFSFGPPLFPYNPEAGEINTG